MSMQPRNMAEQALQWMSVQGFDAAQVDVSRRQVLELNIANNEPSLMRSAGPPTETTIGCFLPQ